VTTHESLIPSNNCCGLDTNVLVRYLTQDDPVQSIIVNRMIEGAVASGKKVWICQITLCETAWVLKKCYSLSKEKIRHVFLELLLTPQIKIENEDTVWNAFKDYETNSGIGMAECLIARINSQNGCEMTYTFDKAAARRLPTLYKEVSKM
jgi:predicted nucleic-acid-binding protein